MALSIELLVYHDSGPKQEYVIINTIRFYSIRSLIEQIIVQKVQQYQYVGWTSEHPQRDGQEALIQLAEHIQGIHPHKCTTVLVHCT